MKLLGIHCSNKDFDSHLAVDYILFSDVALVLAGSAALSCIFLFPSTSQILHSPNPPRFLGLRHIFRWSEPICAYLKSREPENSPPQLSVHVTRQKTNHKWMRTARHDDPRGFAAKESVPENCSLPRLRSYVSKCGARQPRSIKKPLENCWHTYPPNRIYNYKMVSRLK